MLACVRTPFCPFFFLFGQSSTDQEWTSEKLYWQFYFINYSNYIVIQIISPFFSVLPFSSILF